MAAARHGVSTEGGTLYCKMTPCYICAKLIINTGIKRVIVLNDYHAAERSKQVLSEARVTFELLNDEFEKYDNQ